jgi:hypothetical protein
MTDAAGPLEALLVLTNCRLPRRGPAMTPPTSKATTARGTTMTTIHRPPHLTPERLTMKPPHPRPVDQASMGL